MNLDSNIEFDLKRFFLWWGRELAFLMPEKLRQWLSDQSGQFFLTVEDEQLQFSRMVEGDSQLIATLPLNEQASGRFQRLKTEHAELEKAQCIMRLTGQQAIGKILLMPAAVKENLLQVLIFEMDRYMPFKADQVYFSFKLLSKPENGHIRVLLVVTPKAILDSLYQNLNNIGIHPIIADYAEIPNDFEQDLEPYNLLPEHKRPTSNKIARMMGWSVATVVMFLAIAVLVFPVWHESRIVDSLKQQIQELEKDTRIVQSRQLEIDDIVNETTRLINTKNSSPSLVDIINTLSKLIPDDTSLTHLQFSNGRLQIQGQSPTASALIGVLEASSLLSNARFVSPLTQDKRTGMERFQISVEVNSVEAPSNAQ